MKKRLAVGGLVAVALILAIVGGNVLFLQWWIWDVEKADSRNEGIEAWAYHPYGVVTDELIFDLRGLSSERSKADVTRFLLQFAERLKGREFTRVSLAWQGDVRFLMKGSYFKRLGEEYGIQKPVYTLRTLPENLYRPNGQRAFGTWTGGWLGVLGQQLDDLNRFHQEWYLDH